MKILRISLIIMVFILFGCLKDSQKTCLESCVNTCTKQTIEKVEEKVEKIIKRMDNQVCIDHCVTKMLSKFKEETSLEIYEYVKNNCEKLGEKYKCYWSHETAETAWDYEILPSHQHLLQEGN
jgi:murein L,D-transpeptidase YafK